MFKKLIQEQQEQQGTLSIRCPILGNKIAVNEWGSVHLPSQEHIYIWWYCLECKDWHLTRLGATDKHLSAMKINEMHGACF